jgi:hypothetical protein
MRDSENRQYTEEWLQVSRPQPMYDSSLDSFYEEFYSKPIPTNDQLAFEFMNKFDLWLYNSFKNDLQGLTAFPKRDVIYGVTQYIDDLYQRLGNKLRSIKHDYKYHWRLNQDIEYFNPDNVIDHVGKELIISMPFPQIGDIHPRMNDILDQCDRFGIPVHIDGAWIGSVKDITFNFDHPAIKTIGFSLSKAGMGSNRVGVRYSRETPKGAVTLMNEFNMQQQSLLAIGIGYLDNFPPDYFWNKYEDKYNKILKDFNLQPTKSIHLALRDGQPVGVRPLLRCL